MSSAAGAITKIPELRKKIIFTLTMVFFYRVGIQIPTPGINSQAMADLFKQAQGTIFQTFNLFSGGALERFSIFALGIMPYISASIVMQLFTVAFPYFEQIKQEGEQGQKRLNQYTRYGTVLLSFVQGYLISKGLEGMSMQAGTSVVMDPGWSFRLFTMLTLTSGTVLIMWMGEQITERGIGNGTSLIIFSGIAAGIPGGIGNTLKLIQQNQLTLMKGVLLLAIMVVGIGFIIWVERAARRVPIQYAKRQVGRRIFGAQQAHLPVKLNMAGVMPPIFASALIMFPATLANVIQTPWMRDFAELLQPNAILYNFLLTALIIFFAYFWVTEVGFKPKDVAENLKKNGGFIPGVRPGDQTADFFTKLVMRLTLVGALYLCIVCVLPTWMIQSFQVSFYFGGTSLLILVGVCLDTLSQIESVLVSRNYETIMKGTRLKGRRA